MNIRDLNNSANRPDSFHKGSRGENANIELTGSNSTSEDELMVHAGDRIEISDSVHADEYKNSPQLDFARKVLHNMTPVSQERASEIRRRIEEGYYLKPEVVNVVAERLSSELKRKPL